MPAHTMQTLPVDIAFTSPEARALYCASDGNGTGSAGFLAPATALSVGFDLRACLESDFVTIAPGERLKIHTGIAVQPHDSDVAGFVYSRSGLGAKQGLTVAQGVGVIDPDYTGEIMVFLLNTSKEERRLERGERMAQLIFQPILRPAWREVAELSATDRGSGGFGHTGR